MLALRSSRRRPIVVALIVTSILIVVLAHSASAEGQPGHHGVTDMGGEIAMCLAVIGGAIDFGLALVADRIGRLPRPSSTLLPHGCWRAPASRIEPVARAGPTELQVFRR